jgi:hypothetical protein
VLSESRAAACDSQRTELVVFGEPGDMMLLGAHGLEGLNLRVDLARKALVPAGPVPAALVASRRRTFPFGAAQDLRTERMLPAGSLNQAMSGPIPRLMPFSSCSNPS